MFCFSTSPQTTSTFPRSQFSKKACSNSPERSSWLPTTAFSSTGFQLLSLDSTVSAAPNVSPIFSVGRDGKRKTSVPAPSPPGHRGPTEAPHRSEEHTSELQSHSFISYAVFCLK